MKAAICSNDEEARYYLETILLTYHKAKEDRFEAFEFATGDEAFEDVICFDIVFLDIDTDNIRENHIEKKLLSKNEDTTIVYIKEQSEFLKRAYPKAAIYTLPKPIDAKEVFAFLDRYFYFEKIKKDKHSFILKNQKTVTSLYIEDLLYFERKGFNSVKTVLRSDKTSLKGAINSVSLAEISRKFLFTNPKTMVNPEFVDAIAGEYVIMENGDRLLLSKKYKDIFLENLNDYIQNKILPIDILQNKSRIKPI